MATEPVKIGRAEALAEAYKRGLLPPQMKSAYEEAQKRGLVGAAPAQPNVTPLGGTGEFDPKAFAGLKLPEQQRLEVIDPSMLMLKPEARTVGNYIRANRSTAQQPAPYMHPAQAESVRKFGQDPVDRDATDRDLQEIRNNSPEVKKAKAALAKEAAFVSSEDQFYELVKKHGLEDVYPRGSDKLGRAGISAFNVAVPGTVGAILEGANAMFGPGQGTDYAGNQLEFSDPVMMQGPEGPPVRRDRGMPTIPQAPSTGILDDVADVGGQFAGYMAVPGKVVDAGFRMAGAAMRGLGPIGKAVTAITPQGAGIVDKSIRYGTKIAANTIPRGAVDAFAFGATTSENGSRVQSGLQMAADPLNYAAVPIASLIQRAGIFIKTMGARATPEAVQLQQAMQTLQRGNATPEQMRAAAETINRITPPSPADAPSAPAASQPPQSPANALASPPAPAQAASAGQPSVVPQPTVSQAGTAGAGQQAGAGVGAGGGGAVPPVGPATLQATPRNVPVAVGKEELAVQRDTLKAVSRFMRGARIPRNVVNDYTASLLGRYEPLKSERYSLAFFVEDDLPQYLQSRGYTPAEARNYAGDTTAKLQGWGRAANSFNESGNSARYLIQDVIHRLTTSQKSELEGTFKAVLGDETLMGRSDEIGALMRQNGEEAYNNSISEANRLIKDGKASPEQVRAAQELNAILTNDGFKQFYPDSLTVEAATRGKTVDQLIQERLAADPIEAAHWLQSEIGKSARNARDGLQKDMASTYEAMRKAILDRLEQFPGYRGARMQHGDLFGADDAVSFGDRFLTAARSEFKTDQMARELEKLSPRQQAVAALSIRDAMLNPLLRGSPEDAAARITELQKEGTLKALVTVLGEERGTELRNAIANMRVENQRISAISQAAGSNTHLNQQGARDAIDNIRSPGNRLVHGAGNPTGWGVAGIASMAMGNPLPLVAKAVASAVDKASTPGARFQSRATKGLYGLPEAVDDAAGAVPPNANALASPPPSGGPTPFGGAGGGNTTGNALSRPPPRTRAQRPPPTVDEWAQRIETDQNELQRLLKQYDQIDRADPNVDDLMRANLAKQKNARRRIAEKTKKMEAARAAQPEPEPAVPNAPQIAPSNAFNAEPQAAALTPPARRPLPGETSNASPAVTGALLSGGLTGGATYAATGDEDLALRAGGLAAIGGAVAGNRLAKFGSSAKPPKPPVPKAPVAAKDLSAEHAASELAFENKASAIEKAGNFGDFTVSRGWKMPEGTLFEVRKGDNVVGTFVFEKRGWSDEYSIHADVNPEFQRQGVATAFYDHVENAIGQKLKPSGTQSPEGAAFTRSRQSPSSVTPLNAPKPPTRQGMGSSKLPMDEGAKFDLTEGFKDAKVGDATLEYVVQGDGYVELSRLKVPSASQGEGQASRALDQFLRVMDENGLTVHLTAEPVGGSVGMSKPQLEKFYKSRGFVPNKGSKKDFVVRSGMIRTPRSKLLAGLGGPSGAGAAGGGILGATLAPDANGDGTVDAQERANGFLGGAFSGGIVGKALGSRAAGKLGNRMKGPPKFRGAEPQGFVGGGIRYGKDPTKTENIFRDNVGKPFNSDREATKRLNRLFDNGNYIDTKLPTHRLYATQENVHGGYAENTSNRYVEGAGGVEAPAVVKYKGNYYVTDGHHRITKAVMDGKSNVRVRLYDVDGDTALDTPLLDFNPERHAKDRAEIKMLLDELFADAKPVDPSTPDRAGFFGSGKAESRPKPPPNRLASGPQKKPRPVEARRPAPRGNQPFRDPRLSPGENKTAEMIQNGYTYEEIADEMMTSLDVVKKQASNAQKKLGADVQLPRPGQGKRPPGSTKREAAFELFDSGVNNAQIAERLGMSIGNVKTYRSYWREQSRASVASIEGAAYNPPAMPTRPFEADYPQKDWTDGPPVDAQGRLTRDMDGRPLDQTSVIIGRNKAPGNGPKSEADRSLRDRIAVIQTLKKAGSSLERVPRSSGQTSGGWRPDFDANGRFTGRGSTQIVDDLDRPVTGLDDQEVIVLSHELAHSIDFKASPSRNTNDFNDRKWGIDHKNPHMTPEMRAEYQSQLERIYRDLNNPINGEVTIRTPKDRGYEAIEADRELWAEAIRAYMYDPNYIKTVAPDVAFMIRDHVNRNSSLRKTIQFNAVPTIVGVGGLGLGAAALSSQPAEAQKR